MASSVAGIFRVFSVLLPVEITIFVASGFDVFPPVLFAVTCCRSSSLVFDFASARACGESLVSSGLLPLPVLFGSCVVVMLAVLVVVVIFVPAGFSMVSSSWCCRGLRFS